MLWVILYLLERGFHAGVTSRCNSSHDCLLNLCLPLLYQSVLQKLLAFIHKPIFDLTNELLSAWIVNSMINCLLHQYFCVLAHLGGKKDGTILQLASSLPCEIFYVDSVLPKLYFRCSQSFCGRFD